MCCIDAVTINKYFKLASSKKIQIEPQIWVITVFLLIPENDVFFQVLL